LTPYSFYDYSGPDTPVDVTPPSSPQHAAIQKLQKSLTDLPWSARPFAVGERSHTLDEYTLYPKKTYCRYRPAEGTTFTHRWDGIEIEYFSDCIQCHSDVEICEAEEPFCNDCCPTLSSWGNCYCEALLHETQMLIATLSFMYKCSAEKAYTMLYEKMIEEDYDPAELFLFPRQCPDHLKRPRATKQVPWNMSQGLLSLFTSKKRLELLALRLALA
jgi:hypothetical protein